MNLVVDASVAVKWFLDEPLQEPATQLLQRSDLLCAPDLVFAEVANVAWKLAVRGEIDRTDAIEIVEAVSVPFSIIHSALELRERSIELGLDLGHPVYDCMYLACAEAVDGVVVTADERFVRATAETAFASRVRHLSAAV